MPVDPAAVLAALNDGVYLVDRDRRITYWNLAASEISGFPACEVVGSRCADGILNHVDASGRQLCGEHCPLQLTMQDGRSRTVQVFLHHKSGRLRPVQVTSVALVDDDGRIVGAAETFRDDSAHRADRERAAHLERLSLQDPLTGLANRRYLETCLATRFGRLAADGSRFGVLMLDLDHFKRVNDSHGHETGDEALRTLARTLELGVRPGDSVVRFGGEEFVVVTPVDDADRLVAVAERLRELVRGTSVRAGEVKLTVTVSIGVTMARPGDDATTLLERADSGLLSAKRAGRDRVVLV
ncbi:MAG: sensor domain-containing diguanylate cyclase [Cellulomonas sp.]|nr:sensor domain-containing diguanylate cyclase [Cellulomonas sp.]